MVARVAGALLIMLVGSRKELMPSAGCWFSAGL